MTMLTTRTGGFTIGFRRGGGAWQRDVPSLVEWAKKHGFGALDLGRGNTPDAAAVRDAGLKLGSVDLGGGGGLIAVDSGRRAAAQEQCREYIAECGPQNFFAVMVPEDAGRTRRENFGFMAESLNAISGALEAAGGRLVIEGWPGPGALCCTPESCRAAFRECPSPALGLNYDPSHLLRMGIDPVRFLNEFVLRVGHVHGKDTLILADDLYEYGTEQPATFKNNPFYGASAWRYVIPGHGGTPWPEVCRILAAAGYAGVISIELEDADYHGSDALEQQGLLDGAAFLATC